MYPETSPQSHRQIQEFGNRLMDVLSPPDADRNASVRIDVLDAHRDERGAVFEPLPGDEIAGYHNMHVVLSVPGAVRGNHYHVRGTEITTVIGPTLVRFLEGGAVRDINVPAGEVWRFRFPPGVPHAFRNTGDRLAVLASFNTEEHDRSAPDAVREVLLEG
jgi:quercetin dioxygenase-like cupin family protein